MLLSKVLTRQRSRMNRDEIREKTMQMLFQMDVNDDFDYNNLVPIEEDRKAINKDQAIATLEAIKDHIVEIDDTISKNLEKWSIDRIAKTDLAILRNSVAEILYRDDIPNKVSVNEAVELAKKYGDEKSYAFVNSILSKIISSL